MFFSSYVQGYYLFVINTPSSFDRLILCSVHYCFETIGDRVKKIDYYPRNQMKHTKSFYSGIRFVQNTTSSQNQLGHMQALAWPGMLFSLVKQYNHTSHIVTPDALSLPWVVCNAVVKNLSDYLLRWHRGLLV